MSLQTASDGVRVRRLYPEKSLADIEPLKTAWDWIQARRAWFPFTGGEQAWPEFLAHALRTNQMDFAVEIIRTGVRGQGSGVSEERLGDGETRRTEGDRFLILSPSVLPVSLSPRPSSPTTDHRPPTTTLVSLITVDWSEPGVYQMHLASQPQPPVESLSRAVYAIGYQLFSQMSAEAIYTDIPHFHRGSRRVALVCGLRPTGESFIKGEFRGRPIRWQRFSMGWEVFEKEHR